MQQVDRHALTATALRPGDERCEHGDGRVERSDDVDDRDARLGGCLRRPGDAHQPAHRLHERVVAGEIAARMFAEAADLAVHDARIAARHGRVVEPEALERAGLEVRDDDVGARAQLARQLEVGGVLEVEHDRALVAIGGVVVRRAPLRVRRRQPAPRVVACGRLDLDHVRPQIAERLPDERPGEHPREVDHEDPVERRRHGGDASPLDRPASRAAVSRMRRARPDGCHRDVSVTSAAHLRSPGHATERVPLTAWRDEFRRHATS